MKMLLISAVLAFFLTIPLQAQRYITKTGEISFYSETPVEDIEAHNKQVNAALDMSTGQLVFKVLMKSFEFEKALMQEHFNENYVESDKYPTATFSGKIVDMSAFSKDAEGPVEVTVEGDLTIHGVTNPIKETATLEWKDGAIQGNATFMVAVADYDIKIPTAVVNNIAKEVEVIVDVSLDAI